MEGWVIRMRKRSAGGRSRGTRGQRDDQYSQESGRSLGFFWQKATAFPRGTFKRVLSKRTNREPPRRTIFRFVNGNNERTPGRRDESGGEVYIRNGINRICCGVL